jgi:SAM-dependent methyltransferase
VPANLHILDQVSANRSEFDISDDRNLTALLASQDQHFWFTSRNLVIGHMLRKVGLAVPARVIEVGCGAGVVLRYLTQLGYKADGLEMHQALAQRAAGQCAGSNIYCVDLNDAQQHGVASDYDAVGVFDVIEHVDEPIRFLESCTQLVKPGGLVVGTVPALMCLWSDFDCGHRLRYTRRLLTDQLREAGLRPVIVSYFFQSLVLPMWLQRKRIGTSHGVSRSNHESVSQGLQVPPPLINQAFRCICAVERMTSSVLPLARIPGASLFFAATS